MVGHGTGLGRRARMGVAAVAAAGALGLAGGAQAAPLTAGNWGIGGPSGTYAPQPVVAFLKVSFESWGCPPNVCFGGGAVVLDYATSADPALVYPLFTGVGEAPSIGVTAGVDGAAVLGQRYGDNCGLEPWTTEAVEAIMARTVSPCPLEAGSLVRLMIPAGGDAGERLAGAAALNDAIEPYVPTSGFFFVPTMAPLPEVELAAVTVSSSRIAPRTRARVRRGVRVRYRSALVAECGTGCRTRNYVRVLNRRGKVVRSKYLGLNTSGSWRWDGRNGRGRVVRPGRFRIRVVAKGYTQRDVATRRVRVIRRA